MCALNPDDVIKTAHKKMGRSRQSKRCRPRITDRIRVSYNEKYRECECEWLLSNPVDFVFEQKMCENVNDQKTIDTEQKNQYHTIEL